jgi:ligand-binding sensor domain-containing protein/serine phosphatase RsbU (regulator of sigma subunit)
MKRLIRSIFLFSFLFACSAAFSQHQWDQLKFQRFGVDQGLGVTTAFNIVQDDYGFLWIATIDGLQRYDGYSFVHYKNDFNDSASLSDNTVSTIIKGKGNVLWVGTYSGGLNRLDISTGKFSRYQSIPGDEKSLSSNRVWAIYEDAKGMVWVGTDNGLNCLDPVTKKVTQYFHKDNDPKSLCGNSVLSILGDKKGRLFVGTTSGLSIAVPEEGQQIQAFRTSLRNNIVMSMHESGDKMWIGTTNGLVCFKDDPVRTYLFSEKSDSVSRQVYSYLNSYGENAVRAIYEDKYANLWLCTDKGLKILNPATEDFISYYSDPGDPSSLSADLLYGFCEDRSGNIWIGTMVGGLNKADLKPKKFRLTQTQNGNPSNLSRNNIRSIFMDSKNVLWVGTLEGGLNRMNVGMNKFGQVKDKDFNAANFWCIYEDKKGMMWFGTSSGLISYNRNSGEFKQYRNSKNDPNTISDDIVRCIHETSKGELWVGTEGGLNKFEPEGGTFVRVLHDDKKGGSLSNNTVWAIAETSDALWVATDNGLNRHDFRNDADDHDIYSFEHYFPEAGSKNSLSNRSIRSIWVEKDSILWLATSNGFDQLNSKTNAIIRFNEENGLANSYTYGVLGDDKGRLWISTNNGISRFNIADGKFKNFDKQDGLQNNEFNTGAYFKSSSGELFFGGPDGFNRFFPDSLSENKIPPQLVVTSIKVLGIPLENEKQPYEIRNISLNYNQNVISFEFSALDFTVPGKNTYSYKLEGFDKDWIEAGSRRFVSYTNLDPGKYRFRVRASNNDGTWNEEGITIDLSIVPPFWRTWWFRAAAIAFAALAIYWYVRRRLRRVKENEERLEKQVKLKTRELRKEKEIVEQQSQLIEKKNHSITSSIRYAKRIQDSILPQQEKLNELVPDSFIFFKPKDIVSGDFYWFTKQHNRVLFAAVDCTGHGVPGAFMSLIGNNLLNDAVKTLQVCEPDRILMKVHEGLVKVLKKGEQQSDTVDGMDITLCILDLDNHLLEFSSTGRPLIHIRDGEATKYRVGKHPLGLITKKEIKLETKRIPIRKNDTFYIFTDGYCDQFGGEQEDKYLDDNFEKFLLRIQDQKMADQAMSLEKEINDWRGNCPQIDDMLVIGIRC